METRQFFFKVKYPGSCWQRGISFFQPFVDAVLLPDNSFLSRIHGEHMVNIIFACFRIQVVLLLLKKMKNAKCSETISILIVKKMP